MDSTTINFEELKSDAAQLMQELGSPDALKNLRVPFPVAVELRKHQIARLEDNITILRRKQDEFNRKMEDYISSLTRLIANLRRGVQRDSKKPAVGEPAPAAEKLGGTHVRCVGCGAERDFIDVNVLVALEPEDYLARPTEVIVQKAGQLKKGFFSCPRCGEYNLTIRPR